MSYNQNYRYGYSTTGRYEEDEMRDEEYDSRSHSDHHQHQHQHDRNFGQRQKQAQLSKELQDRQLKVQQIIDTIANGLCALERFEQHLNPEASRNRYTLSSQRHAKSVDQCSYDELLSEVRGQTIVANQVLNMWGLESRKDLPNLLPEFCRWRKTRTTTEATFDKLLDLWERMLQGDGSIMAELPALKNPQPQMDAAALLATVREIGIAQHKVDEHAAHFRASNSSASTKDVFSKKAQVDTQRAQAGAIGRNSAATPATAADLGDLLPEDYMLL